jgi:hypothetical protein
MACPYITCEQVRIGCGNLDRYLADRQKTIPGNRMPFPGLKTKNERRDVIAYLIGAPAPPTPIAQGTAPQVYTEAAFGQRGSHEFSVKKLLHERPEYFVFNGAVGALSKLPPLQAKVGETVRIFSGVGGPNYTSSFHVIGEIFDRVYNLADVQSPPARGVQTVKVPAGGAVITEFKLDVPGDYVLVDHALSRAERGLLGIIQAEGAPNPEIFEGKIEPGSGH